MGLDPDGRNTVWELVRELRARSGAAVLLTTHYMDEAESLCDRVGVMHESHLVALGTPRELAQRVGPQATLDDVFVALTGRGIGAGGEVRDHRRDGSPGRSHA